MRPQMLNLDKIIHVNFMSTKLTECVHFMLCSLTSYSKTIGRGGGFYFLGDRVVSSTYIGTLIVLCSISYLKVS